MSKGLKLILNLLLLFCLVACSRSTNVSPLLKKAEEYMNEKPDSALLLLDSITTYREDMSEAQNALWCLLYTQAQDKKRIEHTSDSLIQIAVKYYEKTNFKARKMQAYYYCGNVFYDLNDALQAQEYYLKAYEVGKKLNNPYLLGRLCANLGTLYTYQELYQPAMAFQKEAVDCFLRDEDTVSLSVTFRNIARIHVCESRLDSAIVYYSKALLYTSGSHEFYMLNELADAYGRVGDTETGLTYAWKAYSQIEIADDSCLVNLTLGDLYLKSGKMDSAYHYLSFCRKSTDIYTLKDTYYWLSQLEKARRNLDAYVVFQEQYEAFRDSTDRLTYKETLTRLQSMYDYLLVEREKEYYRKEADRKTIYMYSFLGGTILFLLVAVILVFSIKEKKKEKKKQYLRLQEQQARESKQYQAERNATILELEQKTRLANGLKMELDIMKGIKNEQTVDQTDFPITKEEQYKIFLTSDLYRGLRSKWDKLDSEQWLEVVKWIDHILYLNFTYKIKMMYPQISEQDLQICCLTKLEIPVSRMAVLLAKTSQAISLGRKRLYKKMTGKQGTAQDFDTLILSF